MTEKEIVGNAIEDAKVNAMREVAWKVHCMICVGKSIAEIDHYMCSILGF